MVKPTIHVARELGISDVALAKICTKLDVPKPPLGYWRRVEVGVRAHKAPLPKLKPNIRTEVWIHPTENNTQSEDQDPEFAEMLKFERDPGNKISVGDTLRNAHPLVRQASDALAHGSSDE